MKNVEPMDFYLKKVFEQASEDMADRQNEWIRDALQFGTSEQLVNPTRWFLFKLTIKRKINSIRRSIAEWIGGDTLHEYCGDY